jgi:hypothetical protein
MAPRGRAVFMNGGLALAIKETFTGLLTHEHKFLFGLILLNFIASAFRGADKKLARDRERIVK